MTEACLAGRTFKTILKVTTQDKATMATHSVHSATAAEIAAVADVLTLAFGTDPAARWSWADPRVYLASFPRFVRAFGGAAFERGTAYVVDDNKGAALWLPPGAEPDETAMGSLMQETVPESIGKDGLSVMQQMESYHPGEPHWYLPLIGIDPAHQGRGLGGVLMRHALAECDRDGCLAYLESSNPRNVPLYQHLGFELLGTIQAGTSPKLFPMLRKPQRRS